MHFVNTELVNHGGNIVKSCEIFFTNILLSGPGSAGDEISSVAGEITQGDSRTSQRPREHQRGSDQD